MSEVLQVQESNQNDRVLEQTDSADFNRHQVLIMEREAVRRDDARGGQQHRAWRQNRAAEKKFRELAEAAPDLADGSLAGTTNFSTRPDLPLNFRPPTAEFIDSKLNP